MHTPATLTGMPRRLLVTPILAVAALMVASVAPAQTGANVLVVANKAVPASVRIAEAYVAKRRCPPSNSYSSPRHHGRDLEARFRAEDPGPAGRLAVEPPGTGPHPLHRPHQGRSAADRGNHRTGGHHRQRGFGADAALPPADRRRDAPNGAIPNPYLSRHETVAGAARFSHGPQDIYLVTRLDGFTEADAMGLIERGSNPAREGKILLDERGPD